jgi:cell division protein FtsB
MIWDLIFSDHGYFVFKHEYEKQEQLALDIDNLKVEKEKLSNNIIDLRDDAKILEEVIHRELGYVYPDETMIIMPDTKHRQAEQEE